MRKNWIKVKLGSILEIERGGSPRPIKKFLTDDPEGINWIKIGDTKNITKYIRSTKEKIKPSGLKKSRLVVEGDFILSNSMSFGRPYIMETKGAIHDGWLVLRNKPGIEINKDFLYYALSSPIVYNQFDKLAAGSTVKNLNIGLVSTVEIGLPPLPEQRVIVAKIEQLFSELDNGIANLKAAREKLEIYRQAVLKKAFEGELTKAWRAQQNDLPTADELLEQIKAERDLWIDKEILNANTEAKRLRNKLKKNKAIIPENESIPASWRWTTFLQSCHLVVDCHNKTAPYEESGIYLIRTSNVRNGKLNLKENIKYISQKTYEYWSRRCFPEPGDILFTREAPMGEATIIPENTKVCLGQRMMLLRVFPKLLLPKYLLYNILSATFQQRFSDNAIGTGVKHLRVGDVESLVFPVCSVEEQHQIVQEIETRLSVCDKLAASIEEGLEKAEALQQSILKKAFEGRLLSEAELEACRKEPDWEPVAQLLERIKGKKVAVQGKLFEV